MRKIIPLRKDKLTDQPYMKRIEITLYASNLMDVFRLENRSHSHGYAPSFHDGIHLMRLDSGFHICF